MPLSPAPPRTLQHMRDIVLRGYEREDGLVDIEARMTDLKPYSWRSIDRGEVPAGAALHDMWMRVTLGSDMVIRACEAAMESTPYSICPGVAPNFARLAGLTIGKGFIKQAMQRLGGVEGCTHLRELLQPIATVAFQTMISVRRNRPNRAGKETVPEFLVNTCHAYAEDGPVVQRARAASA